MFQGNAKATPTQPTTHLDNAKMQGDTFLHIQNEELVQRNVLILPNDHSPRSSFKEYHWQSRTSLMCTLMFSLDWEVSQCSLQIPAKPNVKPTRHVCSYSAPGCFPPGNLNLEWLGVLEPVKEVTEWVNSFVIMEKKVPMDSSNAHSPGHSVQKKLWICLDPRALNEALKREPYYYTWSIEEILWKFHGMTWFTIADFNKGYWMVKLHQDSRKLTTMALDIGSFQGTRLPMSSIIAQDVSKENLMQFS